MILASSLLALRLQIVTWAIPRQMLIIKNNCLLCPFLSTRPFEMLLRRGPCVVCTRSAVGERTSGSQVAEQTDLAAAAVKDGCLTIL
ncbi:hypothetical protein J3F83DRAFT_754350 [Trichoderma novae-zelandiae]